MQALLHRSLARRLRRTATVPLWRSCFPPSCQVGKRTAKLFGTKVAEGNPPGDILIDNDQTTLDLDLDRLERTITRIRDILGYPTYDVSLLLVEDEEMRETNLESRGINKPTDILSFPFLDCIEPGKLQDPRFDIPDYYNLGDMMLDVPYVVRGCKEDESISRSKGVSIERDRGVSGAMENVFDPEERINMLLVHGMLHLVGHDHEEDEDFELMVSKEEEIMKCLGLPPYR